MALEDLRLPLKQNADPFPPATEANTRVKERGQEAEEKRRHPSKRTRRWIVEVAHSWFNRFRKLLVRYEKLERSFLGLTHLAAAISRSGRRN